MPNGNSARRDPEVSKLIFGVPWHDIAIITEKKKPDAFPRIWGAVQSFDSHEAQQCEKDFLFCTHTRLRLRTLK